MVFTSSRASDIPVGVLLYAERAAVLLPQYIYLERNASGKTRVHNMRMYDV